MRGKAARVKKNMKILNLLKKSTFFSKAPEKEFRDVAVLLGSLDKKQAKPGFESAVMAKIEGALLSEAVQPIEAFFKTAKYSLAAAAVIFGVFATFSFFTPVKSPQKYDKIEALNKYVLKDTVSERGIKDILLV